MLGDMEDAIPPTSWIIDLESASKDVGKRSELGRAGVLSRMEGVPWSDPYGSGLTYPSVDAILPVKVEEGVTPWQYTLLYNEKKEKIKWIHWKTLPIRPRLRARPLTNPILKRNPLS